MSSRMIKAKHDHFLQSRNYEDYHSIKSQRSPVGQDKWDKQFKSKDKQIENLKAILSYMQISLNSRENMIKQYTEENTKLREKIYCKDKLINRLKGEVNLYKRQVIQEAQVQKHPKQTKFLLKGSGNFKYQSKRLKIAKLKTASYAISTLNSSKKRRELISGNGIKLVSSNQGLKNADSFLSNGTSPKSVVFMEKSEALKTFNSSQMLQLQKILSGEENYYTNIAALSQSQKADHPTILRWLLNDFKKLIEMHFKVKDLMNQCNQISEIPDVETVFKGLRNVISDFLNCDKGEVYLLDENSNELWTSDKKGKNQIIKAPVNQGIYGYVIRTSNSLKIDEAYSDPRFDKEGDQRNNYRTKTILCVPIMDRKRDKILGVIEAVNKFGSPCFSFEDEQILYLLATQAFTILTNTTEFNQIKTNFSKSKRILEIGMTCFTQADERGLQVCAEKYMSDLLAVKKSVFWYVDEISGMLYRIEGEKNDYYVRSHSSKAGLIGKCLESRETFLCLEPKRHQYYNLVVDVETELPLFMFPIFNLERTRVVGISQVVHFNSFFQTEALKKEEFEQDMISLFCQLMSSCIFKIADISKLSKIAKSEGKYEQFYFIC